jgi:toxin YoeB
MKKLNFTGNSWADYLYWQSQDKKTLRQINKLIQDIDRNGNTGIGKPEPLKGDMVSYWSRHIDEKNRMIRGIGFHTPLLAAFNKGY